MEAVLVPLDLRGLQLEEGANLPLANPRTPRHIGRPPKKPPQKSHAALFESWGRKKTLTSKCGYLRLHTTLVQLTR